MSELNMIVESMLDGQSVKPRRFDSVFRPSAIRECTMHVFDNGSDFKVVNYLGESTSVSNISWFGMVRYWIKSQGFRLLCWCCEVGDLASLFRRCGNYLQFLPMDEYPDTQPNDEQSGESPSGAIPSIEEVHAELRIIAAAYMRQERGDHTLQPTALVNEAYLKLVKSPDQNANGQARFLGIAARAMRQVLVDHARAKASAKRGGKWDQVSLSGLPSCDGETAGVDTLALNDALERLAVFHERSAWVVELRFFGGLTIAEAAEVVGVSHGTVEADWTFAKAWLHREIEGEA
tara:strand:- start:204 stop:1076 length:873 start_codon:yes stop_codon:yes gene_type:complete